MFCTWNASLANVIGFSSSDINNTSRAKSKTSSSVPNLASPAAYNSAAASLALPGSTVPAASRTPVTIKVSSSVPIPAMASCKCWQRYSTSGVIKPIMTSSNFPPNSLFKSSIKSRPNSVSYLDLICWRWALERVVRIFIISSSLVPKPFIAARKVWLSAAASNGLTGTTINFSRKR
ncbi:hypothetical protein GQX74_007557 [Glossina fuscipes]|nr:hypothetical protein GQX74_007557 [Glossina fuscipes]